MKKRLRIIAGVNPSEGGPIEGIRQQAPFHAAAGIEEHVVSLDPPDAPWVQNFPLTVFGLGEPLGSVPEWKRRLPWRRYGYRPALLPWLKAHVRDYDVVTVHGLWNYSTMAARLALVGSGVPYLAQTHGMLDPWFKHNFPVKAAGKQAFWLFNEGPLLNNAGFVLFTTEEEKILARESFGPYRVNERVIAYGTSDPGPFKPEHAEAFRAAAPKLKKPYLLFLSRVHPKKGCDLLIDAFADVCRDRDDLDLVMAGPASDEYLAELKAQAARQGIGDRIHWPGLLRGDAKWGAFHQAEAFVMPSHQENFGIVVAEAMACSRPVLITNKVNIWREVTASGGGLAENDDLAGTARCLAAFLEMPPEARALMGARAREAFLRHFQVSQSAKDVNAACLDAIAGRT